MAGRLRKNIILGAHLAFVLVLAFLNQGVGAVSQPVVYKAPDGFQVWSYAGAWDSKIKLKSVYDELLKNSHGEEFKLLNKIVIYPGPDAQGTGAAGRWYGVWKMDKGKPRLQGGSYIELYNGNENTGISDIARTLSHEYGHHFTYYHYFKKENKLWESWRTSGLASARQLKDNPKVSAKSTEHRWLIQEIAAEDYVQLFGSITVRQSVDFEDITERLPKQALNITFSTDIFNYRPQENYEIPLAANLSGLRDYWQKSSGIINRRGLAPSQVELRLSEVKQIKGGQLPQYVFSWDKSTDESTAGLEYTLVRFSMRNNGVDEVYPIKTVHDGEALEAVMGSASEAGHYMWEHIPSGLEFFVVYVKDAEGLITSSKVLAVNFANSAEPSSVLLEDRQLSAGSWVAPRIKVKGKLMTPPVETVIRNGVMMVHLRTLCNELGASIEWDAAAQTAVITGSNSIISMQIGSLEAFFNGQPVTLGQAPELSSGSMLVPLRFITQALGAEVSWDSVLQLAEIK